MHSGVWSSFSSGCCAGRSPSRSSFPSARTIWARSRSCCQPARSLSTRRCASHRQRPTRCRQSSGDRSSATPVISRASFPRPSLSRLVTVLAERFGAGDISLSEVQTVCLRLWQSKNPEALLAEKGPQGLLEDYLGEALDGMPAQLRPAAIALLAQMVTSAGTRNVISAGDLFSASRNRERHYAEPARSSARGPQPIEAGSPRAPPRSRPLRDHQRVPGSLDQPPPRRIPPIAAPSSGTPSAAHLGIDRRGTPPGSGDRDGVRRAGISNHDEAQSGSENRLRHLARLGCASECRERTRCRAPAFTRGACALWLLVRPRRCAERHDRTLETTRSRRSCRDSPRRQQPRRQLAFSPDGRTLVSGNAYGTARLWDVATYKQLGSPLTATTAPSAVSRRAPMGARSPSAAMKAPFGCRMSPPTGDSVHP